MSLGVYAFVSDAHCPGCYLGLHSAVCDPFQATSCSVDSAKAKPGGGVQNPWGFSHYKSDKI